MMRCISWLLFYFLTEERVNADQRCWEMEELNTRKNWSISCSMTLIFVQDFKIASKYDRDAECYLQTKVKQLLRCNGLRGVCDINNVNISAITRDHVNQCNIQWPANVCITYECIPGEVNTLIESLGPIKAKGSIYHAAQLSGFLRCSIYGHISNVSVTKLNLADISVRDEEGFRFINFYDDFLENNHTLEYCRTLFTCTKVVDMEVVEVTIHTRDVIDFMLIVKGGKYFNCRNTTYGLESKHWYSDAEDWGKCLWFKEHLMLATTFLSLLLSLVLTIVHITKCLRRKNENSLEESSYSPSDSSSCHPTVRNYESNHLYMDVSV